MIIWRSKRTPEIEEVAAFVIFVLRSFPSAFNPLPPQFPVSFLPLRPHSQVQGSPLPPSLSLDAEGEALCYSRPTAEEPLQVTYRLTPLLLPSHTGRPWQRSRLELPGTRRRSAELESPARHSSIHPARRAIATLRHHCNPRDAIGCNRRRLFSIRGSPYYDLPPIGLFRVRSSEALWVRMKSILGGISTTTTPKKLSSISDGYNLRLLFAGGMNNVSLTFACSWTSVVRLIRRQGEGISPRV